MAEQFNLNAVFVQVRPTADAFWPSPYEPWSQYLTGTQGQDPGYDPLAFIVEEAHTPQHRAARLVQPVPRLDADRPGAARARAPGPAAPRLGLARTAASSTSTRACPRRRSTSSRRSCTRVEHYDIDGVHFDDYFYPYPVAGQTLPDAATYAAHGAGFDDDRGLAAAQRRQFVETISERIKELKPWVKFGISPFGIWRNRTTDPLGSETGGSQSYDLQFADTRKWVLEGWLDYINPQIYWQFGLAVADYAKLVPWWADVAATSGTHLYIGEALYKVTSGVFTDPAELSNHLTFDREIDAAGHPRARQRVLLGQARARRPAGLDVARARRPLRAPRARARHGVLPVTTVRAPVLASASRDGGGVGAAMARRVGARGAGDLVRGVPRRRGGRRVDVEDASNLIATRRAEPGVRAVASSMRRPSPARSTATP